MKKILFVVAVADAPPSEDEASTTGVPMKHGMEIKKQSAANPKEIKRKILDILINPILKTPSINFYSTIYIYIYSIYN